MIVIPGLSQPLKAAGAAQFAQHRGSADRPAQLPPQPSARLATARVAKRAHPLHQAQREALASHCQGLDAFAERALRTAVVDALEAPDLDGERNAPAEAGTVGDCASVVAVQT